MLKLPEVLGVAEARSELPHVLEDVERGRTFIIKGPKGREAFVISADVFRRLQDAYLEVVGELETVGSSTTRPRSGRYASLRTEIGENSSRFRR